MTGRIPLRDRHGSVRAHALVDAADLEWLSRWRWCLHIRGYPMRRDERGLTILLHRELLGLERGDGLEGDHINLDKLDNRRENLRVATRSEQMQNVPGRPGTSTHRGVCWHKERGRWHAETRLGGKKHHLGYFDAEQDAAAAAAAFRAEHMPYTQEAAASRAIRGGKS